VGDTKEVAGIYLGGSNLGLGKSNRFTDLEDFTYRIREKASIKDNRNINDQLFFGFTQDNTGIIVAGGTFGTDDDIIFEGNDVDYVTFRGGTLDTRGYSETPENVLQVESSGTLNPSYSLQRLGPNAKEITFDPAAQYLFEDLYIGKTFTLYSDTDSTHCLKLEGDATFIGQCKGSSSRFLAITGAAITFRIIDAHTVMVQGAYGVLPASAGTC
jgi:hypothetical protein